jgi:uncharacterized membrane protein
VPYFALSGVVGTAAGRLFRVAGIEKVGAPVAASINNLSPFISNGLAILLLGERVTVPILLGTLVIVLGTFLLSLSEKQVGFRGRHLVYPFLCASCFGVVAVIRKLGLGHAGPLFGSAINATAAMVVATAFVLASGNRRALVCDGRSLLYFIGGGIAENTGVFLVLLALGLGEVSVVVPLAGTAPLFVLLMTFFWRGREKPSWRVIVGAVLIVLGVFLLKANSMPPPSSVDEQPVPLSSWHCLSLWGAVANVQRECSRACRCGDYAASAENDSAGARPSTVYSIKGSHHTV